MLRKRKIHILLTVLFFIFLFGCSKSTLADENPGSELAIAFVIDKSGSMAENSKMDFARTAVTDAMVKLKDRDLVTIIGFDSAPFLVLRITSVREAREFVNERISRLFPAGKTNLFPALDQARRELLKVQAKRKHVIVLTDGKIPDQGPFYLDFSKGLVQSGITVSTIFLGASSDTAFLKELSEAGKGRFYNPIEPRDLPQQMLNDVAFFDKN